MHRDGRQDTWAEWKSDVIGLSDEARRRYLRDVEGFSPEQIDDFEMRDAAAAPDDWVPGAARDALQRFFTFKRNMLDGGTLGDAFANTAAREAALSPDDERARTQAAHEAAVTMMPGTHERVGPPPPGPTVDSNESRYGGAAKPERPAERRDG